MARKWTFVTNHGFVLSHIARHPESTTREIAQSIGITERTVHKIIAELEVDRYIVRMKTGRQNRYLVNPNLSLRHPSYGEVSIGQLLEVLNWEGDRVAKEQMRLL